MKAAPVYLCMYEREMLDDNKLLPLISVAAFCLQTDSMVAFSIIATVLTPGVQRIPLFQ